MFTERGNGCLKQQAAEKVEVVVQTPPYFSRGALTAIEFTSH